MPADGWGGLALPPLDEGLDEGGITWALARWRRGHPEKSLSGSDAWTFAQQKPGSSSSHTRQLLELSNSYPASQGGQCTMLDDTCSDDQGQKAYHHVNGRMPGEQALCD